MCPACILWYVDIGIEVAGAHVFYELRFVL